MFKEMRKKNREISKEEAISILNKCEYGVLSMIGINGYAYGVPISYAYSNNKIYFHCAKEGSKVDNLKENDKVSFTVVGDTEVIPGSFTTKYESTIAFGIVSAVSGDEKEEALIAIINKYSPEFLKSGKEYINRAIDHTNVMKIEIDHISGKASK